MGRSGRRAAGEGSRLQRIVAAQKAGRPEGICAVCSGNPFVIRAALRLGVEDGAPVLIESTCNQVNQYGGYTGLKPADFNGLVETLAAQEGLPRGRLILGGDHLGPYPFRAERADSAMAKTAEMVRAFVRAGCTKIHLDASHRLADDGGDPGAPLPPERIARRCAALCAEAESAWRSLAGAESAGAQHPAPLYVIGTEVPAPGGSDEVEGGVRVTPPGEVEQAIRLTREAFLAQGLEQAWRRVIAVVAQPGVEFGSRTVIEYDRRKAAALTSYVKTGTDLVLEGHSTDYQTAPRLRAMVEDGIAVLKVGPALTAAAREAALLLACIEEEWLGDRAEIVRSDFAGVLDEAMRADPRHWQGYGSPESAGFESAAFERRYSFFDRQRYYWAQEPVAASLRRLFANLRLRPIPLPLLSQFLPAQYRRVRLGRLRADPEELLIDRIMDPLREYAWAVGNRRAVDADRE